MSGLFVWLGTSIDSFLSVVVTNVSTATAAAITPVVAVGLTLYITVYGLAVMRHEVTEPVGTFVGKAIKISLILAFALSSGLYQSEIVGGVQAVQNAFTTIVAPDAGPNGTMYTLLDNFDAKGAQLGIKMISEAADLLPWGGWIELIAGLITFLAMAIMLLVCGGFLIMAKTAIAFVLAIGPMFIASLAFPPVAKFFDAWFSKVMNYTFLTLILAFVIGAAISIVDKYLSNFVMTHSADGALAGTNAVADAFGLVTICGALLIVLYQAPNLASGLAGGASLSGGGAAAAVMGYLTGKGSKGDGGGKQDQAESGGQGGSISGSSGGGSNDSGSKGATPAYRRATIDRLGK